MKPKKIKARKMWIPVVWLSRKWDKFTRFFISTYHDDNHTGEVYVLPADAASVEAMVEQMARAIQSTTYFASHNHIHAEYHDQARAALAAIGIK